MLCVEDHFQTSKPAFEWALKHMVDEDDDVHIVTVLPPVAYSVTPVAPLATAGAVSAVTHQWEAQKKHDEMEAADTLKQAVACVRATNMKLRHLHTHALPAMGGASGVGATLVEYANAKKVDVTVLGSRGHGAMKRSMLSMVGLGSVSDHCVHTLHSPVLVVRQGCHETLAVAQPETATPSNGSDLPSVSEGGVRRKICVAVDASEHSKAMMEWALGHLIKETDELHIITVAPPISYPILDDTSPAVSALETKQWQEAKDEALKKAEATARAAVEMAGNCGVPLEHVWFKSLIPEGGASGVGESICHYLEQNGNNMLVVGNRGLGAFQRCAPPHRSKCRSAPAPCDEHIGIAITMLAVHWQDITPTSASNQHS